MKKLKLAILKYNIGENKHYITLLTFEQINMLFNEEIPIHIKTADKIKKDILTNPNNPISTMIGVSANLSECSIDYNTLELSPNTKFSIVKNQNIIHGIILALQENPSLKNNSIPVLISDSKVKPLSKRQIVFKWLLEGDNMNIQTKDALKILQEKDVVLTKTLFLTYKKQFKITVERKMVTPIQKVDIPINQNIGISINKKVDIPINQNIENVDDEEKPWIHVNTKEDLTEEEKVELTNLLCSFGNSENMTDMENSINDLNRFVSVNRKYIGKYVKTKLLKLNSEQRMLIEINNLDEANICFIE